MSFKGLQKKLNLKLKNNEKRQQQDTRSNNAVVETERRVVDILPSYQFYNELHRHIPTRGNSGENTIDMTTNINNTINNTNNSSNNQDLFFLPSYEASIVSLPSNDSNCISNATVSSNGNITAITTTTDNNNNNNNNNSSSNGSSSSLRHSNCSVSPMENINVDKIYSMNNINSQIEITVHITSSNDENNRHPNSTPNNTDILKEYHSNELITGYVIIENKSKSPISFEMFYLTLEGYNRVFDKKLNKKSTKRFLRMVDMSASWSEVDEELTSGYKYGLNSIDKDGCILGLPKDRCLKPSNSLMGVMGKTVKYKKHFMFKVPDKLLDVNCPQDNYNHLVVPPSFGVDKIIWRSDRLLPLKVNSKTGVGHLSRFGSPVITNDLAPSNCSIHYSIDSKFIGLAASGNEFCILKESSYQLRFVPDSLVSDNSITTLCNSVPAKFGGNSYYDIFNKLKFVIVSETDDSMSNLNFSEGEHKSFEYSNALKYCIVNNSTNYSGMIHMTVTYPSSGNNNSNTVSYYEPSVLRKINHSLEQQRSMVHINQKLGIYLKNTIIDNKLCPTSPITIKSVDFKLVVINYCSLSPINFNVDPLMLISFKQEGSYLDKLKQIINEFDDKYKDILKVSKGDLETLADLNVEIHILNDIFKINQEKNRNWKEAKIVGLGNNNTFEFDVSFDYLDSNKYTLVPEFQSCLCGRLYCVRVEIDFNTDANTEFVAKQRLSVDVPLHLKTPVSLSSLA
ncbi:uncharacterized protein SCDLUD_002610 [Saccharomycodes ludwigii]|uniref:uncharacterized protein n=1 Tax=Saccharomycodes ludwigii TaxID=36035 RepID=UPI001E8A3783|nr:hypothetical protein SCDLUD_002610 [Saccharomycodes ludwigii]KAH3901128.1 hypothetical protein SCDLUD_002610 [Saccharomycodes ludwigii]